MEQEKTRIFVAVTAADAPGAQGLGLPALGLYYRIGETGGLQRAQLQLSPRGGLMGLFDAPGLGRCQPEKLARDIQAECSRRGYRGAVMDFAVNEDDLPRLEQLCGSLQKLGVRVYVPEPLWRWAGEQAVVIAPAAVSGGEFDGLLQALISRYGAEHLCLDVVRCCQDFPMPARNADGVRLDHRAFHELLERTGAQSFFSPQLCCKYFTYRQEDGAVHFVLFDDADTASAKLERIRQAGIGQALLLFSEWGRQVKAIAGV